MSFMLAPVSVIEKLEKLSGISSGTIMMEQGIPLGELKGGHRIHQDWKA